MGKENYMKYYLNYPIDTSIGISPYCIRLLDWDEYIPIAGKYLTICEDLLRRRLKLGDEWKLLDYVMLVALNEPNGIEEIEKILEALSKEETYGIVLRAKGMVPSEKGGWIYFDYVPEESNVRDGKPDVTGKFCVIGSKLNEEALKALFEK